MSGRRSSKPATPKIAGNQARMAAILDAWRGDAAPRPAALPSQPVPPSPRRGIDPRNELRQCYVAELQELVAVVRDQPLIATARVTMHPPEGAPMVGRYPMRDYPTIEVNAPGYADRELRALRAMRAPILAVVPAPSGWAVGLACAIVGETVEAQLTEDVDWNAFLDALRLAQGQVNVIVTRPDRAAFNTVSRAVRVEPKSIHIPDMLVEPGAVDGPPSVSGYTFQPEVAVRSATTELPTHVLVDVVLLDSPVRVERQLAIPLGATLDRIHMAIQEAFGFDNSHAWEIRDRLRGGSALAGSFEHRVAGQRIAPLLSAGIKEVFYLYDFGDSWRFAVKFVAGIVSKHPDKVHPVASIGPDLVDDIGGVWGLERMLAAYERWKSGVGGDEIDEDDAEFDVYFEEGWRPDRSRKEPR